MLPDHCLQARDAVGAEHEPDLEGAEAAAQRDLPVAVVGDGAGAAGGGGREGGGVLEVGRGDGEGGGEEVAGADEEDAVVVGNGVLGRGFFFLAKRGGNVGDGWVWLRKFLVI